MGERQGSKQKKLWETWAGIAVCGLGSSGAVAARCIYRVQIENGSDKNAVILSEIAVAFGDFHQVRMCHIPI
jgi:hypothetical protein